MACIPRMMLGAAFAVTMFAGNSGVWAADPNPADWQTLITEARGQTVYWNAWGGSDRINAYIAWVGQKTFDRFGVTIKHVKLSDTADAVSRVLAEKTAGKSENGSVDLIWINGENFAAMKRQSLTMQNSWATQLPAYSFVDVKNKPSTELDFTLPTEGQEAPWGMAQVVFYYNSADVKQPPRSADALLDWVQKNPGRFSYPKPPNFLGSTFLKQVLYEKLEDPSILLKITDLKAFDIAAEPVFAWLDALHPHLWRKGQIFPANGSALKNALADGETDIAFSFNPSEASSAIANGELPDTVRSYVFDGGTIGNTHFVTIPFNATAKAGAMVVANFLMSAEAQLKKQDEQVWGDPTVLDVAKLTDKYKSGFSTLKRGVATLTASELGAVLPEPHASWMSLLEEEWTRRYSAGQ